MPVLYLLFALTALFWTSDARAEAYACLDSKGAVICHVTHAGDGAKALCNATCPACKNACTAQKLVSEGGGARLVIRPNPDADYSPNTVTPGADNQETARKIIEDGLVSTPK
jgi:hypothetical protein